jgi:hypothetical protein
MTVRNVRITAAPNPHDAVIEIDGQPIQRAVRSYTLTHNIDDTTPQLTHDLAHITANINGQARILLFDATRDALLALGWTPPGDGPCEPFAATSESAIGEWLAIPAEGVTTTEQWAVSYPNGDDLEIYDDEAVARRRAGQMSSSWSGTKFGVSHREVHTTPWRPVDQEASRGN